MPAVAADPTHPEWCGACAARALDAPNMPPSVPSASGRTSQAPWSNPPTAAAPPEGAPVIIRTRVFDGILTGLAAATVGGVLWWGLAYALAKSQPDFEYWHLGSAIVGIIVGFGVLIGSRRGGLVSGILALVFSTAAVLVTVYFIDRSQTILALTDAGRSSDVALWQGVSGFTDVWRGWWEFDQTRPLMWLAGPVLAVLIAGWPGRRPFGS